MSLSSMAPLRAFIVQFSALLDGAPAEQDLLRRGSRLLRKLLLSGDAQAEPGVWLPDDCAQAHPERYSQYLLYADPAGRFSVVSFVWGPGQATPIHNHSVWGLVGMLRGSEYSQRYRRAEDGRWLAEGEPVRLTPGDVEPLSPSLGDVHRVSNAHDDRVSISVHVYGADIGAVRRWVYDEQGSQRPFISGYSNTTLPNLWGCAAGAIPTRSTEDVRATLLARREIALLDVREEDPYAQSHPLFAANMPYGQIELQAWRRLPRRDVPIVVYDNGEGLAEPAALRLQAMGYTEVCLLAGGLSGWKNAGGELFRDVNVPSKSFGELVESHRHTPSLSAQEVRGLLDERADVVVLDARRYDEYHTMSIPTSFSVPGAELVMRARELAPNPATRIIVNCAGRTRSIIGTQSLVNAGIPNPVSALRNGTIGWTLAGQQLAHGQTRRHPWPVDPRNLAQARASARNVADRAGVPRVALDQVDRLMDPARTVYRLDVRTPEEYRQGHLPGFSSAPGGQLVQETDHTAAVRGARLVLADDDGVRANMTASWLAQMGWEVHVVDGIGAADLTVAGADAAELPEFPALSGNGEDVVESAVLPQWQDAGKASAGAVVVIDLAASAAYVAGHVPGAWFALRSNWDEVLDTLPAASRYVLTSPDGALARYALPEFRQRLREDGRDGQVLVLSGGTQAWSAAGMPLSKDDARLASPRIDRYRRPYEGTDNPVAAMQGYLDWEYGLVEQLGRDGTHGFFVI